MAGGLLWGTALLWGAALGGALQRGGCCRWPYGGPPRPHSETFVQAQHRPYLTLCGGRVCSTYRTWYRVASRWVMPPGPDPCPGQGAPLQELQQRMKALEERVGGAQRGLERAEALGEQLLELEERLGACDCGGGKNAFGYRIRR